MPERLGPRPHAAMTRCHGNVTIGADSRIVQPILVVDDDSKIVQLVRAYLEREGYPVVTASDGRAALAAIEQHAPGLIVLDLMLPELDGMTVARRVREDTDVPILMLSARGSVADRIQGMSEGAEDYLPKPFSPADLDVRALDILRDAGCSPGHGRLPIDDLRPPPDQNVVRRLAVPAAHGRPRRHGGRREGDVRRERRRVLRTGDRSGRAWRHRARDPSRTLALGAAGTHRCSRAPRRAG